MNKNIKTQIEIESKLQNKSEAYINMKLAEENRKKYLENFINKINRKIDNAVRIGCTYINIKINIMNNQNAKAILYKSFTRTELNTILDYFNKKGYDISHSINNTYHDIHKVIIHIIFCDIK